MANEEFGRKVSLRVRPAKVTNLNAKPEKAGTDLLKRVDLSIEFIARTEELPHFLDVAGGAEILWDEEEDPVLREVRSPLPLDVVIVGVAKIGRAKGTPVEFQNARLKKITAELMAGVQATIRAQVRIDPDDQLNMLYDLVVDRGCKFGFQGAVLVKADPEDPDAEDGDNDAQGKLPV